MSVEVARALLTSPVLVAVVYGLVSILVGRLILQAKEEQLKSKDQAIEALKLAHSAELQVRDAEIAQAERSILMPTSMLEQAEAMRQFFDVEAKQYANQVERLTSERDEALKAEGEARAEERARVQVRVRDLEVEIQRAIQERETAEAFAKLLAEEKSALRTQRPAESRALPSSGSDMSWALRTRGRRRDNPDVPEEAAEG